VLFVTSLFHGEKNGSVAGKRFNIAPKNVKEAKKYKIKNRETKLNHDKLTRYSLSLSCNPLEKKLFC
jgi:hypothetical protein